MTLQVRAHFDGKVLVPDEPLDLPVNEPLTIQVLVQQPMNRSTEAEIDAAFARLRAMGVSNANIPDEAITSESIYGDD